MGFEPKLYRLQGDLGIYCSVSMLVNVRNLSIDKLKYNIAIDKLN